MSELQQGSKAPDFFFTDQYGNTRKLSELRGQKVVLYFYPEDDTEACTNQACNLRDNYAELRSKGYFILGVSPDGVEKHQKFIKKYKLPFDLAADTSKKIINKYKVWGEKLLYGKKVIGLKRTTFIIDEKGKIERIIIKPITKKHSKQILK